MLVFLDFAEDDCLGFEMALKFFYCHLRQEDCEDEEVGLFKMK